MVFALMLFSQILRLELEVKFGLIKFPFKWI